MGNNTFKNPHPKGGDSMKRLVATAATVALCANATSHAQPCTWEALSAGGFTSSVRAFAVFDDGTGPRLHVGGGFRQSLGSPVSFIGRLEGHEWSGLGSSVGGPVLALTLFDDGAGPALYVGGAFGRAGAIPNANGVARWDGKEWSALGSGLFNSDPNQPMLARALAVFDEGSGPALYVGGNFDQAGGLPATNIARWDGQSWSPLGDGLGPQSGAEVRALAVYDDPGAPGGPALYAGGNFPGGIARWDGSAWQPVVGTVGPILRAFKVFDDGTGPGLYAGGQLSAAGGVPVNHIARWDGQSWSPLVAGTDFDVRSLHVFDDGRGPALYVGGAFHYAGGIRVMGIARWDGREWSALGSGMYRTRGISVDAMATFDDGAGPALYVGGIFTEAGGVPADNIARWRCQTCYADCDRSGVLDIFDFLCFQNSFVLGESYACECDPDPACDIFDFLCFQNAFVAGCP